MIPSTMLALAKAFDKEPNMRLRGIRTKGVRLTAAGKIAKTDSAPPHVKAARRRKAKKVTGARAAK